jgi:hypothetical protein
MSPRWRRWIGPGSWVGWTNLVVILGVIAIALWQLHPSLLLADTTTAGGDTGAHVILPAFMKSNLLAHGQLTGWDPDWYDGFPVYTFYFPLPAVLTVVFNGLVTYNVAFKLVTILGTITLPIAAWAFGRLAGLRDPGPACLAASTLPFLFEPSFSIYGGNILSTMAGEYSYSLGLSVALVFLGLVARGLRTNRQRGLAAVLLAATILCHLITGLFAIAGAVVWLILDRDLARALLSGVRGRAARSRWSIRLLWLAVVGAVGVALTAWWLVPFDLDQAYTTNMGWTNVEGFPHLLFPGSARWVLAVDLIGLIAMVVRRNRVSLFVGVMAGFSAAVVCLDPQGKLYNVRFLPLWFLCLYLFAGLAVAEVTAAVARRVRRRRMNRWVESVEESAGSELAGWRPGMRITRFRRPRPPIRPPAAIVGSLLCLVGAVVAVVPPLVLPATDLARVGVTVGADQPSAWATWNYSGYQEKPDYPEYKSLMQTMASIGATQGCGRAMWEYDPSENRFGTTMALMLLPYWTNGCIDSMEGLLFESATTTPFHFLNQNELSATPSDAMVGLPYGGLNVPLGIEHLQQLGVRYFMASSPTVQEAVADDPDATLVATNGPWSTSYNGQLLNTTWKIYRISDSSLVQPLTNQPVVWNHVGPGQTEWLPPSLTWYQNPIRWNVVPTSGGPATWQRVSATDTTPAAVPVPHATVSAVSTTDNTVRFHVDRIGTPVEVKVSYFPNWKVSGAVGPWRTASNMMVVVPTSHEVTLHYGATGANRLGQALTGAGVVALIVLGWWSLRTRRRRRARVM